MRITCKRRDGGEPIRNAMRERGFRLQALAERTRAIDPDGHGISFQLIACLATKAAWAHETTRPRSAELLSAALGVPESELFIRGPFSELAGHAQPDRQA